MAGVISPPASLWDYLGIQQGGGKLTTELGIASYHEHSTWGRYNFQA